MKYILIALLLYIAIAGALLFYDIINIESSLIGAIALIILYGIIIGINYSNKTASIEIWSGEIIKVEHKEEWDEWIPPRTETYTKTDSNGKTVTYTKTIPGYWKHHYATNHITTTDNGRFEVYKTPDGRKLNDRFVNSTKELEEHFPIGSATASTHIYTNKIKSSYSIFKNKEINLNDYPDLFEYPQEYTSYYSINRLLGEFKDKERKSKLLDKVNSDLNNTTNPNNKEKIKGYKQVNLILVNFGDKSEDYGYALQDFWQNGAKNDVVVTFGTDKNGKPTWSYVFSWSEVEILKTDIRELILSVEDINKEYDKTLESISKLIEEKFVRREFAEFDYIQIELSTFSKIMLILVFIGIIIYIVKIS